MSGKPSPDNKVFGSRFSHAKEKAAAGFYQLMLEDDQILASLTATTRAGFHRYRFPANSAQHLVLDLKHRDEVIESSLRIEDSVTVTGMRRSKAWATNQYVFFVMKFSRPFRDKGIWQNDSLQVNSISEFSDSKNLKAFFSFDPSEADSLLVKVAISPVSVAGAMKNLEAELPGWDFEQTREAATTAWNTELSRISVTSKDTNKLVIFYTALYHTAIVPNINMDIDHQYRGRDNAIHLADGFNNYSVFSLWDTYRGAHPLYTIIDQGRTVDYIKTFLVQYQQGGRLPVWELVSNETDGTGIGSDEEKC
jgi:predicted alpha-1,2-mannosidase